MEQAAWTDTREFRARPHEGSRLGASVAAHGGVLGGDVDFERYGFDCLRVFPTGREAALTAASRLSWSRGSVPRYLRLGLGGAATLRGYDEGEFGGESRWYGWCEERFPLLRQRTIPIWRKYSFRFVVDGACFLDGGAIWDRNALEKGRARARWGAGAGLRLLAPIFRLLSLDVATNGRKLRAYALAGLRL
jgi:outer membrane protein assembly factor BamA